MQLAADGERSRAYSANVTSEVIPAQLIPVLNVLLWLPEEALNGDGNPADMGTLQGKL